MTKSSHPPSAGQWRHLTPEARVAVTGASGFIGRHLCARLEALGASVIALQRVNASCAAEARRTVIVDLADREAVAAALQRTRPQLVYHLAGYASGDRSLAALQRAFDANVLATANVLLCAAALAEPPRVVLATSLEASDPWRSAAATGSPYGISKLMVELLAGGMQKLHGLEVVSARIGMAYGPDDPNPRRLVPAVIAALLHGESPQLGSGRRHCDFIYIRDAIDALIAIGDAPHIASAALDIGSGELTSVRRVAETIRKLIGVHTPIAYDSRLDRPNEQERSAELSSTTREIGWTPRTSLTDGLRETIAWYRAQQPARGFECSG